MGRIGDFFLGAWCARCGLRRTRSKRDDIPTCSDCEQTILKSKAEAEAKHLCPVDGNAMSKEVVHKLVIDRCPKCQGVWLDGEELEAIKKAATQQGFGNGLALGIAVG